MGDIKARRIDFAYPGGDELPKYFVAGDIVMSHAVAMLSAMFPDGEDFFVRSVRRFREDVAGDPTLREQVNGFIGQEAMHGREHREFNDRLSALGYPTKGMERFVDKALRIRERFQTRRVNLAVTAALEHYTATLAETLMSNERARAMFTVDEVRFMLLWHALEESEHKAVAFDVYRHAGGRDWVRRLVMNVTTAIFVVAVVVSTTVSILLDRHARTHPGALLRSLARLRRSPFLRDGFVGRIRDYNRPDFHPDDWDATELNDRWKAELFGDAGALSAQLRSA